MTGPLLLSLLAALPVELAQRYRVELAGEPIGWASLSISCQAELCRSEWRTTLRAPEAAGGGLLEKRIALSTDRSGRLRRVEVQRTGGRTLRRAASGADFVPASLAELLLSEARDGERRCLRALDEETGLDGRACARRSGEWLSEDLLGVAVRARVRRGAAPVEVEIPEQRMRFLADAEAAVPERAPRLYGVEVPLSAGLGPGDRLSFCGALVERTGPAGPAPAIPDRLAGSCREQTARYLELAARTGLPARHAVGVAWDGRSFVWHEWAEVDAGGGWMAVDPAFQQLPAEGPRFTLARFSEGDDGARQAAGSRILQCWGRERIGGVRGSGTR